MKTTVATFTSILFFSAIHLHATIVLEEDFESPDVTTAQQVWPDDTASLWVSNESFNGFRKYVVDENTSFTAGNSTGTFVTPDGEQGYTFGYNAQVGMTSAEGAFGTAGTFSGEGSMTLDFLWGRTSDETDNALVWITFYAFNPATTADTDRDNQADQNPGGTEGVDWVRLGSRTSFGSTSSTLAAFQHSVTLLDPTTDYATDISGWDLSVRIGADNFQYGVVDALVLDITQVPEPSTLGIIALGTFGLLLRRRRV